MTARTQQRRTARNPGVAAARHAIDVLRCFTARSPLLGVNEIARHTALNKSTVSRLLATLEEAEFVERCPDTGRFFLGIGLITVAAPALAGLDLIKLARPVLRRLAEECGETVSIGLWRDPDVIMVEQVLGGRPVTHVIRAGDRVPAHCTAAGKIFLAYLPAADCKLFRRGSLRRFTPHTITDRAQIQAHCAAVRERGFATNDEEYEPESCGVATPIRAANDVVIATLTAAVPKHRFSAEQQGALVRLLCDNANNLSRRLGSIIPALRAPVTNELQPPARTG